MNNPECNIEKALVLSTAHMESDEPYFGDIRSAPHQYGEIVFLTSDGGQHVADWFRPAYNFAIKHGCSMILFDRDEEPVDHLPKWDW